MRCKSVCFCAFKGGALFFIVCCLSALGAVDPGLVAKLKGNGETVVGAMTVDAAGNIYLTGTTSSTDLGTTGAYQPQRGSANLYELDAVSGRLSPRPGIGGAEISQLSAARQRPGTVYAVSESGLIKSTDGGQAWTALSVGASPELTLYAVEVAQSRPDTVYVLYGAGNSAVSTSSYKSLDGGETWSALSPLPDPRDSDLFAGSGIAVDPFDADHVVHFGSLTSSSSDGGISWTVVPGHVLQWMFDPNQRNTIYGRDPTLSRLELVRSQDGGRSFVQMNVPEYDFADALFPDPQRPGAVYVSLVKVGEGGFSAIFRSTDFGSTWSRAAAVEVDEIEVDAGTGILFGRNVNGILYRSRDGFQTAELMTAPGEISFMASASPGSLLLATPRNRDMFISKLRPDGEVVFTTYVGGRGGLGTAIAVDGSGRLHIAANSHSGDFPRMAALQEAASGSGLFLSVLSPDGARLESSTLVSTASGARASAIALDESGNIYLTGKAGPGYLTSPWAIEPDYGFRIGPIPTHAFATKLGPDGRTLHYSTYLGNGISDRAGSIVVDQEGNAIIAGTRLWKLNATGSDVHWSTHLPPGEFRALALDREGNIYGCGGARYSTDGVYTTPNAFQASPLGPIGPPYNDTRFFLGQSDAFVTKFSPNGSVISSTILGGTGHDAANALLVEDDGTVTVAGTTTSVDFPTRQPETGSIDRRTGFVVRLNADFSQLLNTKYVGGDPNYDLIGMARDSAGGIVLAGTASAIDGLSLPGSGLLMGGEWAGGSAAVYKLDR